jgi:hypothetical protein
MQEKNISTTSAKSFPFAIEYLFSMGFNTQTMRRLCKKKCLWWDRHLPMASPWDLPVHYVTKTANRSQRDDFVKCLSYQYFTYLIVRQNTSPLAARMFILVKLPYTNIIKAKFHSIYLMFRHICHCFSPISHCFVFRFHCLPFLCHCLSLNFHCFALNCHCFRRNCHCFILRRHCLALFCHCFTFRRHCLVCTCHCFRFFFIACASVVIASASAAIVWLHAFIVRTSVVIVFRSGINACHPAAIVCVTGNNASSSMGIAWGSAAVALHAAAIVSFFLYIDLKISHLASGSVQGSVSATIARYR